MPQSQSWLIMPAVLFTVLTTASVAQAIHPLEGRQAPAIRPGTVDGERFDLAEVGESIVVLDFWATWCPPCRKGLPLLQQFLDWAEEKEKPVAVVTINLQESRKKIRDYWAKEQFTMPVVMDTNGSISQAYGVRGIPQTVVIHNGKVIRVHVGFSPGMADMLKAETEQLLEESSD